MSLLNLLIKYHNNPFVGKCALNSSIVCGVTGALYGAHDEGKTPLITRFTLSLGYTSLGAMYGHFIIMYPYIGLPVTMVVYFLQNK
jgi:hypothetical protein